MKYLMKDLRKLMKENGIKGSWSMLKQELIDVLREKELIPKQEPEVKLQSAHESKPKDTRNNAREVVVENIETGKITSYPSLYSAGKALRRSSTGVFFLTTGLSMINIRSRYIRCV